MAERHQVRPRKEADHTEEEDDDPSIKQLQNCAPLYMKLEDCLVETNRNWRACQKEVQALKACEEARRKLAPS
eukprot:jgi/Mesen1/5429/ME000027S04801